MHQPLLGGRKSFGGGSKEDYFEQRMYWGRDLKGVLVSLFAFFFPPPSPLSGKRSFVTL